MLSYTPADRVVEVIGDYGKEYRLGSGCIVAGRVVLTAAHVVAGAKSVVVRDVRKRLLSTVWSPEDQAFVGACRDGGPDLALVELADPDIDIPPLPLAKVNRDGEFDDIVEGCVTIGYPLFAQRPVYQGTGSPESTVRDTAQAWGRIPVHSMIISGLLSLEVSSAPRGLPKRSLADSEWSGMSGAPVIADGCLVGAVTEHEPMKGTSTITVTPLTALASDPRFPAWGTGVHDPSAWWRKLGADGEDALRPLPRLRRETRYLSVVRDIQIRNGLLKNRERELSELIAFAQGGEGYRLLVGQEYAGKTALLAELVTTRLPQEVDVVSYFVSRSQGHADRELFLAAVVQQLAEILGKTTVSEQLPLEFSALWQEAAQRASQKERHLLLVVDGLDEDLSPPGSPSIGRLLPSAVAGLANPRSHRAHVLVSNRLNFPLPGDIPHNHPLRKAEPIELKPHAEASGYEELAKEEIHSLKGIGPEAKRFLAVLAAAAGPLGMEDLRELTGLSEDAVDELIEKMQRSLRTSGSGDARRYAFAGNSLLQGAQADSDLKISRYREAIYKWADRWRRRWQQDQETAAEVPLYLLDAYPKTLGSDPQRRAALVSDAGWVYAAIEKITVDLVLAELRTCVAAAPDLLGPAKMLATVRGQASFLRSQPDPEPGQVLRQLCLQAAELHETDLAGDFRERLSAYPGLIPQWTSRRPHRALVAEVNGHAGWVNAVALTPDGNVVAGTDDGRVWIWNPGATVAEVITLGYHVGPVRALVVDKHGRVVSGGHDHRIRLWDPLLVGADPVELGQHDGAVRALAIDEGGRVISGGDDARVLVWDEHALEAGPIALGRHAGAVRSVAVGPGGLVVSGGDDHRARLWDQSRPGVIVDQTNRLGGRVMTVAMAPDRSVVMAGTDSMLYRWHPRSSDPLPDSDPAPTRSDHRPAEFGSHHDVVRAVSIVRDEMVVSGGDDGRVLLWRARDPRIDRIAIGRHDGPVRAVASVPDDQAISGGQDQRVRIWDLREPRLSVTESGIPTGPANAVCISPDGCVLVGGADKRVWMWDSADAAAPVELGRHDSPVMAVTALPEGQIVSCGADSRLLAWDRAKPGKAILLGKHAGAVLCALTSGWVVSGGYDGRICRWDVCQGSRPIVLGTHPGPVAAVAALENGRVVSGGTDGDVRIWDPGTPGADPIEIERYDGRLNALAALEDHVVGGGDDGCLWIWDWAGRKVGSFSGHNSWLTSLAAFRNRYLISGGTDGRMVMWELEGQSMRRISVVGSSVRALAAGQARAGNGCLVAAHADSGVSYWTLSVPG